MHARAGARWGGTFLQLLQSLTGAVAKVWAQHVEQLNAEQQSILIHETMAAAMRMNGSEEEVVGWRLTSIWTAKNRHVEITIALATRFHGLALIVKT